MKRVGVMGTFALGLLGLLMPAAASAQQDCRQYYVPQPYAFGYYSGPQYGFYDRDWREARRERQWQKREERREREWRRHEWREHERRERKHWRDRNDWRY
jgi:hypothetical protein